MPLFARTGRRSRSCASRPFGVDPLAIDNAPVRTPHPNNYSVVDTIQKVNMPKKSKPVVEELEVSSDEEIEDEQLVADRDDEEDKTIVKSAASIRNARKKARNSGYRKLAVAVGAGAGDKSSNKDMLKYAISATDMARLAAWSPETGEGVESEEELKSRLALKYSSLPSGAAAILHANTEALARNIMADVVERVRDGMSNTVTAAHMRSALRKLNNVLEFNFELPAGIVEHARTTEKGHFVGTGAEREWVSSGNVLPELTEQEQVDVDEKRVGIKAMNKIIKSKERAFLLKKEEGKQRRAAIVTKKRSEQQAEEPVEVAV